MAQDNERSRELFQKILSTHTLKLSTLENEFLQTPDVTRSLFLGELSLLHASLLRAEGDIVGAIKWVEKIEHRWQEIACTASFQYSFQKACNEYFLGQYTEALESFLRAERVAKKNEEHAYALSNALFCLDNLGESYHTVKAELHSYLKKIPKNDLIAVREQLRFLEDSAHFKEGRVELLFQKKTLMHSLLMNQRMHFRVWVNELPFHSFYQSLGPTHRETYFRNTKKIARGSYRLRTIEGVTHRSDCSFFQPMELADRLYLWTWRWMVFPNQINLASLLDLYETLAVCDSTSRFSFEDKMLIHNALGWISFLLPAEKSLFSRILHQLPAPKNLSPFFEYESLALQVLKDPNNKKLLNHFLKHPLSRTPSYYLMPLVRFTLGEELPLSETLVPLASRLKNYLAEIHHVERDGLSVFLREHRVSLSRGDQNLFSQALASAIALLKSEKSVSFNRFLNEVFGLPRFDPLIHTAKISNLLCRLKKILPVEAGVKTASETVYALGDWSRVRVYAGFTSQRTLRVSSRIQEKERNLNLAEPKKAQTALHLYTLLPTEKPFSRTDLERRGKTSRSTATRKINEWLKAGWIVRVGDARSTRYCKRLAGSETFQS